MTNRQLESYFNRNARFFEGGIPPTGERYAIRDTNGRIIVADDVGILANQFYAANKADAEDK